MRSILKVLVGPPYLFYYETQKSGFQKLGQSTYYLLLALILFLPHLSAHSYDIIFYMQNC